jgi:hypothetical protein
MTCNNLRNSQKLNIWEQRWQIDMEYDEVLSGYQPGQMVERRASYSVAGKATNLTDMGYTRWNFVKNIFRKWFLLISSRTVTIPSTFQKAEIHDKQKNYFSRPFLWVWNMLCQVPI